MASANLKPLLREDCMRLLATERLGRVGISVRALPVILPVQYRMLDGDVVFRTAPGTRLTAGVLGNVVAFEVDNLSEDDGEGWSVLVTGPVTEIRDPASLDQARRLELVSWAPDRPDHFAKIHPELVSGRSFSSTPEMFNRGRAL